MSLLYFTSQCLSQLFYIIYTMTAAPLTHTTPNIWYNLGFILPDAMIWDIPECEICFHQMNCVALLVFTHMPYHYIRWFLLMLYHPASWPLFTEGICCIWLILTGPISLYCPAVTLPLGWLPVEWGFVGGKWDYLSIDKK